MTAFFFHRKLNMQLTSFLSTQPEEGSCARKCLKAAKSLIGAYIQAAVSEARLGPRERA